MGIERLIPERPSTPTHTIDQKPTTRKFNKKLLSKLPFWSLRFGHFCHFSPKLKPFAFGSIWFQFCCHFGPKLKSAHICLIKSCFCPFPQGQNGHFNFIITHYNNVPLNFQIPTKTTSSPHRTPPTHIISTKKPPSFLHPHFHIVWSLCTTRSHPMKISEPCGGLASNSSRFSLSSLSPKPDDFFF
ncbi:hypothetical protein Hanom_Chr04g00354881 [Helianthus anomalus]